VGEKEPKKNAAEATVVPKKSAVARLRKIRRKERAKPCSKRRTENGRHENMPEKWIIKSNY